LTNVQQALMVMVRSQIEVCVILLVWLPAIIEIHNIIEVANLFVHLHLKNIMEIKRHGNVFLTVQFIQDIIMLMMQIKFVELIVQVRGWEIHIPENALLVAQIILFSTQIQINVFNNAQQKMELYIFMEIQSHIFPYALYLMIAQMELMRINILGFVYLIVLILNGNIKNYVQLFVLMAIMVITNQVSV
jgi:hypothetical protein